MSKGAAGGVSEGGGKGGRSGGRWRRREGDRGDGDGSGGGLGGVVGHHQVSKAVTRAPLLVSPSAGASPWPESPCTRRSRCSSAMACTSCLDKAAVPCLTPPAGDGERDLEPLLLPLRLLRPCAACSPLSCMNAGVSPTRPRAPCLPRFPLPRLPAESSDSSPLLLEASAMERLGTSDRPRLSMRRQCQMQVIERERNAFGGCPRLSRSPTKRPPALHISLDPREKICAIPRGDRDARNFALYKCVGGAGCRLPRDAPKLKFDN